MTVRITSSRATVSIGLAHALVGRLDEGARMDGLAAEDDHAVIRRLDLRVRLQVFFSSRLASATSTSAWAPSRSALAWASSARGLGHLALAVSDAGLGGGLRPGPPGDGLLPRPSPSSTAPRSTSSLMRIDTAFAVVRRARPPSARRPSPSSCAALALIVSSAVVTCGLGLSTAAWARTSDGLGLLDRGHQLGHIELDQRSPFLTRLPRSTFKPPSHVARDLRIELGVVERMDGARLVRGHLHAPALRLGDLHPGQVGVIRVLPRAPHGPVGRRTLAILGRREEIPAGPANPATSSRIKSSIPRPRPPRSRATARRRVTCGSTGSDSTTN